jgi:hypothetical protein
MTLHENIKGVGLAGRDNIGYIGADIIFMSYEGLMSLDRLTQTDGKAPLETVSLVVRNDLTRILSDADVSTIKSVYYQEDGSFVTFMPDQNLTYCFDFSVGDKKYPRITTWTFASDPLCGISTIDGKMYMGLSDSVSEYTGYYDVTITDVTGTYANEGVCVAAANVWETSTCWDYTNVSYNWTFQSPWMDFEDPVFAKIVKRGLFTITGGQNSATTVTLSKDYEENSTFSKTFTLASDAIVFLFGNASSLWGAAKYAPAASPREYRIPLARTGKVIRLKMVTEVNGFYSSLVNTILLTKQGKIR